MSHVVCLLTVERDRATFSWSEGPASFPPYKVEGQKFVDFQNHAQAARKRLKDLVSDYLHNHDNVPRAAYALAETGYDLYKSIFIPGADQLALAKPVRKWLENLREQGAIESFEIVVERPWKMPWNVVYDRRPDEQAFAAVDQIEHWKPFWGLRYNLAGGRKVNPLRRMPLLSEPAVVLVLDRAVVAGLPQEQQNRLIAFGDLPRVQVVHSKSELLAAVRPDRPELLYWMSHATPTYLELAGDGITPSQLADILSKDDFDEPYELGGLAFLNACQTAEAGENGAFLDALHAVGFSGIVATEQQTIDTFAAPLGIDFLEQFLKGEPVGKILHDLRRRVPLGLLYGTYCPPEIRIQRLSDDGSVERIQPVSFVPGIALGASAIAEDRAALPPTLLPAEPYRSLGYYERQDRALFAGRDDDVEHFTAMLDNGATRIIVLHGESGVGKSSFLRAGVIPYLEEECYGYRFMRAQDRAAEDPLDETADEASHGKAGVLFIRATSDIFSQLAKALWDFCSFPYEYTTPLGDAVSVDLTAILANLLPPLDLSNLVPTSQGGRDWKQGPANCLQDDPALLARVLSAITQQLPFELVLVIDQCEEIFTLTKTAEEHHSRRVALEMLRRTLSVTGNFKVILSLRTEYYGRLIARLRRDPGDAAGIREYLLTDFDEEDLVEAIRRPTSAESLPFSSEIPREKYQFRYEDGLPAEIARRVLTHTGGRRRDGVLPLLQVICGHLYERVRHREHKVIRMDDLEELGGVEGGMRKHVEAMLLRLTKDHPTDKQAFERLLTRLYLRQPDGSLTTALLPEDDLARRWRGRQSFPLLLTVAEDLRLLRVASLRIGGQNERRYVSLGHDSLAKIAAEWHEEFEKGKRFWKMAAASLAAIVIVVSIAGLVIAYQDIQAKSSAKLAALEKEKLQAETEANEEKLAAERKAKKKAEEDAEAKQKLLDQLLVAREQTRRARYGDQLKFAYNDKHPVRVERILAGLAEDLRGFEWHFLQHSTLKDKRTLPTPPGEIHQVAWLPYPGVILTMTESGVAYIPSQGPDVPAGADWKLLPLSKPMGMACALEAARVAVASPDRLRVFDLDSDGPGLVAEIEIPERMHSGIGNADPEYCLAVSPSGERVAVAARAYRRDSSVADRYNLETRVAVFEIDNSSLVAMTPAPIATGSQAVTSMAFTPTGDVGVILGSLSADEPAPVELLILNGEGSELILRKERLELAPPYEPTSGRWPVAVLSPAGKMLALYRDDRPWIEVLDLGAPPGSGVRLPDPKMISVPKVVDVGFTKKDPQFVVVLTMSESDPESPFRVVWYLPSKGEEFEQISLGNELEDGFDAYARWPTWAALSLGDDGPPFVWKGDEGALRAIVTNANDPSEKQFKLPQDTRDAQLRLTPSGDQLVITGKHPTQEIGLERPIAAARLINPATLRQRNLASRESWETLGAVSTFVSGDGQYLAGSHFTNQFRLFCRRVNDGKLAAVPLDALQGREVRPWKVCGFRPMHPQLYVFQDSALQRWDVTANELSQEFPCEPNEHGQKCVLTADRVVFASNKAFYVWDAAGGRRLLRKGPEQGRSMGELVAMQMLADGRHLATVFRRELVIRDTVDWRATCRRELPSGVKAAGIAIHPSGTRLVSAETPGRITFWDIGPWSEDVKLQELIALDAEGSVRNLVFTSDGQTLAGLVGTDVHLWRAPGTPTSR